MKSLVGVAVLAIIAAWGVALGACAVLGDRIDRASGWAADAVEVYCENFTADQRRVFGDQVRSKSAPHTVEVTCNGAAP